MCLRLPGTEACRHPVTYLECWWLYWLSTEGGFVGGERVNPVGVLVSGGGLPWRLMSGVVAGGNMTRSCDDESVLCDVCCCDVCCVAVWAAAAVLADVLVLSVAAAAVLAAVTVWNAVVELPAASPSAASVAVAGCFAVERVRGSVAELVHAAV